MKTSLTQERLKECLRYDPDTGIFTWVSTDTAHRRYLGKPAGCQNALGYWQTRIDWTYYSNHRLAFLYMTGSFPPDEVDHIDGNRTNNRWSNLRPVTTSENRRNQAKQRNKKTPLIGVRWFEDVERWRVKIHVDGKTISLGTFDNLFDAAAARKSAELKYGFHANHGRQ